MIRDIIGTMTTTDQAEEIGRGKDGDPEIEIETETQGGTTAGRAGTEILDLRATVRETDGENMMPLLILGEERDGTIAGTGLKGHPVPMASR